MRVLALVPWLRLNTDMYDRVLRAMTDDGAFRVMTVRATDTVTGILAAQDPSTSSSDEMKVRLAELATCAVLYRETMAPSLRVQCILKGKGGVGSIIADSHPEGWTRGLIQLPAAGSVSFGEGALLQMSRSMPHNKLHQGVVEVPGEGVSEAFVHYMALSEQIVTMARVCAVIEHGEVVAAGGYLVQILPEAPDRVGPLEVMAQRLESDFSDITERLVQNDADPQNLMDELLWGMDYSPLGDSKIRFGCDCSRARVMGSLATLGRDEVRELIDAGEPLSMNCHWCNKAYRVELAELQGLVDPS